MILTATRYKLSLFIFCFSLCLLTGCSKNQNSDAVIEKTPPVENNISKQNEPGKHNNKPLSSTIISSAEAKNHLGEELTVKGLAADIVKRPKVIYINFERKFPKNTFTAVIFADKFSEFNDIESYLNKNIEVTGKVELFKGKPQVILNSQTQVKIIN